MKRVFSILLATVMAVSMMAVPAFAGEVNGTNSVTSSTGYENRVLTKDKWGYDCYIKNNGGMNNYVAPLSEAPAMDYVKTIDGVTFSNYIRHTTAKTEDEAGNIISIYKVYIGLNGAMRSDKGEVEFMTAPSQPYNTLNGYIKSTRGFYVNACSDLNMFKTNTPMLMGSASFDLDYLTDIGITPYADGGSDGRAMDGTWKAGLTWVFGRYENGEKSNGSYGAIYPIRVNQGDTVTYYQVAVTDATNYSGQRVVDNSISAPPVSDPVTVAPAKEATAKPNKAPIYINNVLTEFEAYNINGNNYFKLRDVALALRGTEKQFQVIWNPSFKTVIDGKSIRGAVDMTSNKGYTPVGGEMARGDGLEKHAVLTSSPILKDGIQVTSVVGYNIKDNNFFKLRDLGDLFDFNVSWDGDRRCIIVNTAESYDPSN